MHGRATGYEAPLGKNSPIQVGNDWGGLLEVFNMVLFQVPRLKFGLEVSEPRLKVQV